MFHLSIVTPEKIFYEAETESLILPGTLGYLGILTNHAPLLTGLVPGKIIIREKQGESRVLAISGGFVEVLKNQVTILADTVESPDKIDLERAQRAMERARERLKSRGKGIDIPRAMSAYTRAKNRIDIYKSLSSSE